MRNLHFTFVYVVPVKIKVEISQNFVAFSEYMNFNVKAKWEIFSSFCDLLRIPELYYLAVFLYTLHITYVHTLYIM